MPTPEGKTLVQVSETRMSENGLEGLCEYTDGTSEWRSPDVVDVRVDKHCADGGSEQIPVNNVEITSA